MCVCDFLHDVTVALPHLLGTEVEEEEEALPVTDDVAFAVAAMAVDDVMVAPAEEEEEEELGGEGVEVNAYEEVQVTATAIESYNEDLGKEIKSCLLLGSTAAHACLSLPFFVCFVWVLLRPFAWNLEGCFFFPPSLTD